MYTSNKSILYTFGAIRVYWLILCVVYTHCEAEIELKSKYQVQLKPTSIESRLGQLVIIKLPEPRKRGTLYLTKPNGDVIALSGDKTLRTRHDKHYKHRDVFSENPGIFQYIGKRQIILGPLTEDHDGNWVISNLYNNSRGEPVEKYKFITIRIIENIRPESSFVLLPSGETLELAFSFAPAYVETCELVPPSTASDRYYERDPEKLNTCGYKVPNVTAQDAGFWTLIAVGKVAFTAKVELNVVDKVL